MEHERSAYIPVPADRLYKTIAEIGNLTKFIPGLTATRPAEGDKVDVEAEYDGHTQHGQAWFRTDDAAHKVEWGAEGHPYHGWLDVGDEGDGSKLTLHLTTGDVGDIGGYVTSTFDSIKRMFSGESGSEPKE
jgi:hypothetical protein